MEKIRKHRKVTILNKKKIEGLYYLKQITIQQRVFHKNQKLLRREKQKLR